MRYLAASAFDCACWTARRTTDGRSGAPGRRVWGRASLSRLRYPLRKRQDCRFYWTLKTAQPLLDIDVDALEASRQIAGVELLRADLFQVIGADRVREDRKQELDSQLRRLEAMGIVKRAVQLPRVDNSPLIAELVGRD